MFLRVMGCIVKCDASNNPPETRKEQMIHCNVTLKIVSDAEVTNGHLEYIADRIKGLLTESLDT